MRRWLGHLRGWLEETHSAGFELRRHFFLRFFDSDLVSSPDQWRVVAIGALAILLSSTLLYTQAYYHKYLELTKLPTPEPYRMAVMADSLFLITLAMFVMGLFTTLEWPALFPGLRDYLALAGLPLRLRDIFLAKFTALLAFAGLFVFATTFPPDTILPAVMMGRYSAQYGLHIPAILLASSLAALCVFFTLVAVQGILLNILPVRQFTRVSLAVQGILLTALLCGLPLVFSIPSLQNSMHQRPAWAAWAPPVWFLALYESLAGSREPLEGQLAQIALRAAAGALLAAIGTYLWSYRRHRARLLESNAAAQRTGRGHWSADLAARLLPDPRALAVFAFIGKTLARSRQHRLVLTGFAAVAIAVVFEGFTRLALSRSFHGFDVHTFALGRVAVSAPLALSLFVLAGFRYLFRLPVELRANWVFRLNEPGNRLVFLTAVRHFILCCGVIPVALITLPVEILMLGPGMGIAAAILCLLPSLALMEALLIRFEKIPFTSSYLPGRRPLIETLLIYGVGVALYVSALSTLIHWCLEERTSTLVLFAIFVGAWWKARSSRREDWEVGQLEFEELPEPAVLTLSIERD